MKSWLRNTLLGIILVPILAFSWSNLVLLWASPAKLDQVEKKVTKHEEIQDQLAKLVVEQQSRLERDEQIAKLQVESIKDSIALIAELKKSKKDR